MVDRDETGDEAKPVAADIPGNATTEKEQRLRRRPTTSGRIFGGFLAFLSLWQILNPSDMRGELLGLLGLAVSVLWFVPCPRYLRPMGTAALFAAIVAVEATEPPYVPRHGRVNAASHPQEAN